MKNNLRGMSYDDGVRALSPNGTMTGAPERTKDAGDAKSAASKPKDEAAPKTDQAEATTAQDTQGSANTSGSGAAAVAAPVNTTTI